MLPKISIYYTWRKKSGFVSICGCVCFSVTERFSAPLHSVWLSHQLVKLKRDLFQTQMNGLSALSSPLFCFLRQHCLQLLWSPHQAFNRVHYARRRNHYIFSSRKLCACRLTKGIDDNEDPFIDHDNDDDYPQKAACRPQLTQVVRVPMQTGRQAVYQPSRWYKLKSWKWNYYKSCKCLPGWAQYGLINIIWMLALK